VLKIQNQIQPSRILACIQTEVTQFYKTLVNVFGVNKFGPNRTFDVDKNGLSVGRKPSPVTNPRSPKTGRDGQKLWERPKHYLVSVVLWVPLDFLNHSCLSSVVCK